jgi:hypothetical protein
MIYNPHPMRLVYPNQRTLGKKGRIVQKTKGTFLSRFRKIFFPTKKKKKY